MRADEKGKEKEAYSKPRILATYNKEELEEAVRPHGNPPEGNGGVGGCGGGGGIPI